MVIKVYYEADIILGYTSIDREKPRKKCDGVLGTSTTDTMHERWCNF